MLELGILRNYEDNLDNPTSKLSVTSNPAYNMPCSYANADIIASKAPLPELTTQTNIYLIDRLRKIETID